LKWQGCIHFKEAGNFGHNSFHLNEVAIIDIEKPGLKLVAGGCYPQLLCEQT